MRRRARYFECTNCGQVVQGWHAANEWIDCCADKHMVEIDGPDLDIEALHAEAMEESDKPQASSLPVAFRFGEATA